MSFDEPTIAVSKFLNFDVHQPSKVSPAIWSSEDLLDDRKKSLKRITPLDVSSEKKAQTLVFHDNRDLSIVKCKKSEKYIREKFEIFILLSSTKTLRVLAI